MSTCWWSNNIIIAWTRKFIEFLFVKKKASNIFIQRTFHCITISIRPEKKSIISSQRRDQYSRMKKEKLKNQERKMNFRYLPLKCIGDLTRKVE